MENLPAKEHCSQMMFQLFQLLKDQSLCDLTVLVAGEQFHVHKCVFVAACPTLHHVILQKSQDDPQSNVKIMLRGLSSVGFRALTTYIYTGKLPTNIEESVRDEIPKACRVLGITLAIPKEKTIDENGDSVREADSGFLQTDKDLTKTDKDLSVDSTDSSTEQMFAGQSMPATNECEPEADICGGREEDNVVISEVEQSSDSENQRPRATHDDIFPDVPPFMCLPEQGKRIELENHHTNHDGAYCCKTCKRRFLYHHDLQLHARIHIGKKMHRFGRNRIKGSKNAKQYECDRCNRTFGSQKSLWQHLKDKHRKQKYKCKNCGELFTDHCAHKSHITERECHGLTFSCVKCGENFDKKKVCLSHESACREVVKCEHCMQIFKTKTRLEAHNKLFHSVT